MEGCHENDLNGFGFFCGVFQKEGTLDSREKIKEKKTRENGSVKVTSSGKGFACKWKEWSALEQAENFIVN